MVVACLLLAPYLFPQEQAEASPSTRRLVEAMEKMQTLESVRYSSSHKTDSMMARQYRRQAGGQGRNPFGDGSTENLEVVLADGVMHVVKDRDHLAVSGGRMIARNASLPWNLRRDKLADGSPAPFLFTPDTFLAALLDLRPSVVHDEVGTHADRPIEILTVTLTGNQAAELWNSGEMPPMQGGFGMGVTSTRRMGAMGGRPSVPKTTVDVAFTVDPALSLIHEIKVRCYQEVAGGQTVTFTVGAATTGVSVARREVEDGGNEEEGLDEAPSGFDAGLPVRNIERLNVLELDVSFSQHGEAVGAELDERARGLLGLKR